MAKVERLCARRWAAFAFSARRAWGPTRPGSMRADRRVALVPLTIAFVWLMLDPAAQGLQRRARRARAGRFPPSCCCCSCWSASITCRSACARSSSTTSQGRAREWALIANAFFAAALGARLRLRRAAHRLRLRHLREGSNEWRPTAPTAQAPPRSGRRPIRSPTTRFDVVVVGAGGAGLRASVGCAQAGLRDRLHLQGVPDPLAHRGGAGRHFRLARQYGAGRLALAHVRHRQGLGLARRPGRDRISVPQRARRRLRARTLGRAVLAHRGGQDLPAPVRRHDDRIRQGHRAAHLRRRRPHRPRHAAHALRPGAEGASANSSSSISPSI